VRNEEFEQGVPKHSLSDQDRDILDYAKNMNPRHRSYLHDSEIMDRFGVPATAFFMKLNRIIDDPGAMAHDPFTVRQYQAIRKRGMRPKVDPAP
jgi:hypothetical protein